jgi:ribonucleotide reductase beta subunit family protein with ferritin-like domain
LTISSPYQRLFLTAPADLVRQAVSERSRQALAKAAIHIFIVLEGSIALASFSVIRQLLGKMERFPGLLEGMTYAHRDEVRHAQFGITLLQDLFAAEPSCRDVASAHVQEILPLFSEVLDPRPARKVILESLGLNPYERRQRAFGLLQRHLQAVGIGSDVVEPWIAVA